MKRKASTTRPASSRDDIARLEDIPNVGPAVAADLRQLGITSPGEVGHTSCPAPCDSMPVGTFAELGECLKCVTMSAG